MPSSAERGHASYMARTERWISLYFLVAAAVMILVGLTRNVAAFAILAGAILLLEKIRRAREWDLRNREGDRTVPRKVRFAAKSKRE
jgi:4-hydroxybenzoate polyprenyltransferase